MKTFADVRRRIKPGKKTLSALLLLVAGAASAQDVLPVCRTGAFWATHAGTEKHGSRNLTGGLLDRWNAESSTPLTICGQEFTTTATALEALCISPKQSGRLMLARQLTATALNCILSTSASIEGQQLCTASFGGNNPCTAIFGEQIYDAYEACNTACANNEEVGDCIQHLDCWNSGGHYESGECLESEDSCADHEAVGACFDFTGNQPAGSTRACMDARKNGVTIFGPVN